MATQKSNLFGRTIIYTDVEEVTQDNITQVLADAYNDHQSNANDIDYLYGYYKGDQAIGSRTKTIRDDIVNTICENRAKQIVDFKVGYLFGEPVQYISAGNIEDQALTEKIAKLNTWMREEEMESKNVELGEWQAICGTAYKIILQNDSVIEEEESAPFDVYIPEPAQTFVVYSSALGHKPMMGVYYVTDENGQNHFTVYTDKQYFKLEGTDQITEQGINGLGKIPVIEYPLNNARVGAFEPVITLLDALNEVDSNRLDGIEQFIQSLVIAINCDFEEGQTISDIMQSGIVSLKSYEGMNQDLKVLTEQLNQTQTQTFKDDLVDAIVQICAMPNRNGGSSTSDTGVAVVYRDGWSAAESDAKKVEMPFKKSERMFLNILLNICRTIGGLDLKQGDIDIHFDRRNYENIEMKANVLTSMLSNDKIAPRLAFVMSNMFPDAESAYQESIPYIESSKQTTTTVDINEVRED